MLGACCPLGIAAQVPGTERRPGFASTGFPVSFAGLECSCRAAGLGFLSTVSLGTTFVFVMPFPFQTSKNDSQEPLVLLCLGLSL